MAEVEGDVDGLKEVDGIDSATVNPAKLVEQVKNELVQPTENGLDDSISNGEKLVPVNGLPGDHAIESPSQSSDSTKAEIAKPSENGSLGSELANDDKSGKIPDECDSSKELMDQQCEKAKDKQSEPQTEPTVVLSDNAESEGVMSVGDSESPVEVNTDDTSPSEDNSSEPMEVDSEEGNDDNDSNVVEVSSNMSATDVLEVDANNSKNPSLVSEDSSRDSVESVNSAKSDLSSNAKSENLVGTVKGEEGDEILITVNNDEGENKDAEPVENESATFSKVSSNKTEPVTKSETQTQESVESSKAADLKPAVAVSQSGTSVSVSAAGPILIQGGSMPVVSSAMNFIPVQGGSLAIPAGYQLVQQGNQYGYITVMGNQRIFVPATTVIPASNVKGSMLTNSIIASQLSTLTPQQKQAAQQPQVKPEDLVPKSSWEMIELMKWEVQNRIPDNYNWSVAFHKRKEDLSAITTFLQELGSDVVKEQVYKDIIQIQTKKKESGDLKDAEIESLEKMKTVYENTKKKVEHLQLETKECKECKYTTESDLIMSYHRDFPHYDPPWDINRAWLVCAQPDCDFRTRTIAHFIFHQKDIHNVQAKFLEKDQYFQCSLCPLNASTKNKLERHQQKCTRNFKLTCNLQPYYHDTNFCMKTCFYKPKKIVQKPPPIQPQKPAPRPSMLTRQQGTATGIQLANQPPIRPQPVVQQPAINQPRSVAVRQRLPVVSQQTLIPMQPQARPRLTPPMLQRAPIPQQRPVRPPVKEMSGFEVCELCGGYVKDRQALRIHFYYAHKVEMPQAIFTRPTPPLTCEVCKSNYWTTQGLAKHKAATQHYIGSKNRAPSQPTKFPAEQKCFMCLRQFPNLFVHFERVHGMTMKDLVLVRKCIMCGFSASDYKTLESHLGNAHGVLIKVNDYLTDKTKLQKVSPSIISGGKNVGKINYCVFCQIQYPDNIQLTIHCIKSHATCDKCGMVVKSAEQLKEHTCRKAHINRSCYICGTVISTQEKYAQHLRLHVKPCRVRLENLSEDEIQKMKDKVKREYKPAVISLDSDDDSDVEVVETKPSNMKVVIKKDEGKDEKVVGQSVDNKDGIKEKDLKNGEVSTTDNEASMRIKEEIDGDEKLAKVSVVDELVENDENNHLKEQVSVLGQNDSKAEISVKQEEDSVQTDCANAKEEDVCVAESGVEHKDNKLKNAEREEEEETRLLEKDDDEVSIVGSGSRKRKKSESDIDEDELLKDDNESNKRLKTEDVSHENTFETAGDDEMNKSEMSSRKENNNADDMEVDGETEKPKSDAMDLDCKDDAAPGESKET